MEWDEAKTPNSLPVLNFGLKQQQGIETMEEAMQFRKKLVYTPLETMQ